jgi:hypothetical protein
MPDFLGRELRANPAYELALWDRLAPEERFALEGLHGDPDFYGVLRPRDSSAGLSVKAVDRETALLFLTLREAGPLPAYVRSVLGVETDRTLGRLVADGVLEVESGSSFVSGPAAFTGAAGGRQAGGRLARLSVAALRYGQALAIDDPLRLSLRLYGYNRRALSPRWQRRLPSAAAVQEHLGIGPKGPNRRLLGRIWSASPHSETWLSWQSRSPEPPVSQGATYKLYVSPAPEALASGFGAILEAFAAVRAPQFKIGAGAAGLLRADKIVAYFPSFDRLAGAADAIAGRLAGIPAQGVPFTSEIASDGLLSWGMDPPARGSWSGRESWRLWLTHRLARALLAARSSAGEGYEPWRFALERLSLEGIDTETWTPGARLWKEG